MEAYQFTIPHYPADVTVTVAGPVPYSEQHALELAQSCRNAHYSGITDPVPVASPVPDGDVPERPDDVRALGEQQRGAGAGNG